MIYAVLLRLNRCNSFSCCRAIVVEKRKKEEGRKGQKIDDLPILTTCRSGTLAMLSSEVNGLAAHESTR